MSLLNRVRASISNPRLPPPSTTAQREGLKIVRNIIASHPTISSHGLTTEEIYKLALKEQPSREFVPDRALVEASKKAAAATAAANSALARAGLRHQKKNAQLAPGGIAFAPHPEHPIKSMTFLKRSVLPVLEGMKELKIVREARIPNAPASALPQSEAASAQGQKGKAKANANTPSPKAATPAAVTVWVWKAVDRSQLPKPRAPKPPKIPFGKPVGVGEDWSHLNKRRQRARMDKVRRDVWVMKERQQMAKERSAGAEAAKATNA